MFKHLCRHQVQLPLTDSLDLAADTQIKAMLLQIADARPACTAVPLEAEHLLQEVQRGAHRSDGCVGKTILTFTIDFVTAKRYREANKMPHQFRRAAWTDLTVEVYL